MSTSSTLPITLTLAGIFHTIQHEYCHIINQKKPYSTEFGKITPNYTSVWANYRNDEANELGFITNYARANDVEDFAEMTSTMLGMLKKRLLEILRLRKLFARKKNL